MQCTEEIKNQHHKYPYQRVFLFSLLLQNTNKRKYHGKYWQTEYITRYA